MPERSPGSTDDHEQTAGPTDPVLIAPVANVRDQPVYHLPDDADQPRCGADGGDRYRVVDRESVSDRARCCRLCDPDVYVESGDGALCDELADLDPDEVGSHTVSGD